MRPLLLFFVFLLAPAWAEESPPAGSPSFPEPDWRQFREEQNRALAALAPPPVPAADPGANPVDAFLAKWYEKNNVTPGSPSEDAVFLRRVYLDTVGLLPKADERQGFLADPSPGKREEAINRLLGDRQAYAEHWITFWCDLLRSDEQTNIDGLRQSITPWLYRSLLANRPYDEMVVQLLNPAPDGPAGFLKGVQWRGAVNASQRPVIQAAQTVSQVFLSAPMKCASCHDHFTKQWKLKDTYGLAACFSEEGQLELFRCDKPTGESAVARFPFAGLGEIDPAADSTTRRGQAARMVVSPQNPRFARTIVNRLWHRLFGHGLYEPIDDLDYDPLYPELLDWLAYDFMAHGCDLKHTLRQILTSQAYQRASRPADSLHVPEPDYAAPRVRRMQSEQFLDAVFQVTGYVPPAEPVSVSVDNPFVRAWRQKVPSLLAVALGRPNREQVTSVREQEATVLQMLESVNGAYFSTLLQQAAERMVAQLPDDADRPELVRMLFLRAYSREPSPQEAEQFLSWLPAEDGKLCPEALADALWILFMNPEFQYIR